MNSAEGLLKCERSKWADLIYNSFVIYDMLSSCYKICPPCAEKNKTV